MAQCIREPAANPYLVSVYRAHSYKLTSDLCVPCGTHKTLFLKMKLKDLRVVFMLDNAPKL